MRKKRFSFPWSKYISGFLIFLLLVSQTIHVDFFDVAEASPEDYRDVVSIFVDADTYSSDKTEILRYAKDIEGYLGGTRTSLFVIDSNTSPSTIATKNERLYYEGDGGDGISHLVGTVLIGNVPIPMVGQDGQYFPSLYPYVDFVDKQFVYDPQSGKYETPSDATRQSVEAEIWHGVMNPAVGRSWDGNNDIVKIKNFLDKTHDFYTKSGKFAPSTIPPRVFYYDGFYESKSMNLKRLFQYGLSMKNAENLAYKKFTKYLLKDVNSALQQFDSVNNADYNNTLSSLGVAGGQGGFDDATISKMPDIQTETPIRSFLTDFKSIINEKTLGDAMLYVHNAGRYNSGSNVGVDLSPINITLMDDVARATIKGANTTIENVIDGILTGSGIAKRIPIFDHIETAVGAPIATATGTFQIYDNYFFGTKSTAVTAPDQCTIARGSNNSSTDFGKDVLVEANVGYDIMSVSGQVDMLKNDTQELVNLYKSSDYSCFSPTGTAKLQSYWGGNSVLRVAGSPNAADVLQEAPGATSLTGFSQPIFSLGGMVETTRLAPPSVSDCISTKYQYELTPPYERAYTISSTDGGWQSCISVFPTEWANTSWSLFGTCGGKRVSHAPRFTCLTKHNTSSNIPSFTSGVTNYDPVSSKLSCHAGTLMLDGKVIKTLSKTCIVDTSMGGEGSSSTYIDSTTYENQVFHTIPSVLRHISPTDEELAAAKKAWITPSLPIDTVRYVEFLTPKGNVVRLTYPDFFQTPGTDVASVRAWLKDLSDSEWNAIIAKENATSITAEDIRANVYLNAGSIPASPIDWNNYISDSFIEKVLQAKNWLNPDATLKYKQTIETSLSYSHRYPGSKSYDNPPGLPTLTGSYDIAYLGLTSFIPSSAGNTEAASITSDYSTQLAAIQGLNVSDPYDASDNNPSRDSDKCGSPDGVDLFQWPQAIMCWIQSLTPPRIMAGSCGQSANAKNVVSPSAAMSASSAQMQAFYEGGKITYTLPHASMGLNDTLEVSVGYMKGTGTLSLPPGTQMSLTPVRSLGSEYLAVSPSVSEASSTGAKFILSSGGRVADVTVQATMKIPLPGGSTYTVTGDQLVIHISDEYIDVSPSDGNSQISVTSSSGVSFDFATRNGSGDTLPTKFPLSLDVYDDVAGALVASGIVVSSSSFTLPDRFAKQIGVYRLVFSDKEARTGDLSIAVRAGAFTNVTFTPVSSMIVKGASTLGMVELKDTLGNLISPELHSVDISVKGGYIIDSEGQYKSSMHVDAMEPQVPLYVTADNPGQLTVDITADSVHLSSSIQVIDSAKLVLLRPAAPRVGDGNMDMSIQLVDANGAVLSGFNSVATLTLPNDAGYFTPSAIPIKSGTASFTYTPGTYAGVHALVADIPGIGKISDVNFSLAPGDAMYISHKQEGGNLIFSIRDRYGNQVNTTFSGTIQRNSEVPVNAIFSSGTYTIPARSGYYVIKVPGLVNSILSYTDSNGEHTISGIPNYATYIKGTQEQFDFLPDYNARYTVLAGGDFLRESEDILFNTLPGSGQSLAVSTLLDSPYTTTSLFSIIPGGGITVNTATEDTIDTQVTVEQGFPVLGVTNATTHARVARAVYHMNNASMDTCSYSGSTSDTNNTCLSNISDNHIRLALDAESGFSAGLIGGNLLLQNNGESLVTIWKDGHMDLVSGASLVPDVTNSQSHFVMNVLISGETVAKIVYATLTSVSVGKSMTPFAPVTQSTPILEATSGVSSSAFSSVSFNSTALGYRFIKDVSSPEIDTIKNGPSTIDSLAITPETSGVGWTGNNRMLLSYAAGDTVGEATKWFHTYTFVNLGDPVAHVDGSAPGTEQEGIDRSIGTEITSAATKSISSFAHRDMDSDGYEDIVALHSDGYLDLLLNQRGKFRFREQIAYAPDLVNRGITIGDFTHDGYADIIGVDNSGSLVYIDNTVRKFARMDMQISGVSGGVPTGITQFKVYDMDADGREDIAYLTEGGELGILYGTATSGVFDKKVLDANLGVSLDGQSSSVGGALKVDGIPQFPQGSLGVSPTTSTGVDDAQLRAEIYYQYPRPVTSYDSTGSLNINDPANLSYLQNLAATNLSSADASTSGTPVDTYIRSEYAPAYNLEVSRAFSDISSATVHAGDQIQVTVTIHNSGSTTAKNVTYLDTIPSVFDASNTLKYQVTLDGQAITRDFQYLDSGDYDAYFVGRDIPAGSTLTFTYQLTALPMSYGEMLVGNLEKGEMGEDAYGDVGFKTSTTCGADMMLWRSGPGSRDYTKGTRSFSQAQLPSNISSQLTDANNNGIPDSMETVDTNGDGIPDSSNLSTSDQQSMLNSLISKNSGETSKPLVNATVSSDGTKLDLGLDPAAVDEISTMGDNLMSGLQCGFGGGSCMSSPVNWAPLAPGGDPTVLGMPVGDGLNVDEGLPIFSALTGFPLYGVWGCIPIPFIWPPSPIGYENTCGSNQTGAGGYLGTKSAANFLRIFVTPTLTMGMGAAICFGGPASAMGKLPGLGMSPLIQGGNCIVITDKMNMCKGDGSSSDGDVTGISGLGSITDAWNANSCNIQVATSPSEQKQWTSDVISYLKNPDTKKLNSLYSVLQKRGGTRDLGGPAFRMGAGESGTSVGIEIDSSKPFSLGNIVKVKNKRVAGFPDFVMDWVQRQGDEIVNALFTIPHITLYAPTTLGQHAQFDGSFNTFLSKFSSASLEQGAKDMKTQMGGAYDTTNAASALSKKVGNTNSGVGKGAANYQQQAINNNASTINSAAGGLNAMRAAYKFVGKLPFVSVSTRTVPINVPWILPSELDRYEKAVSGYSREVTQAENNFCVGKTSTECADAKAKLNSGGFTNSINQTLKRIQEYKDFPIKLQKYVTWKQRYMSQILCNINTITQLTSGWLKDNGLRFRKWAELYVLIKAIAESWQPVLDIFTDTSKQCGVCRNQRYDLTYWKFKLLSAVIPSIPVIKFPRWPNIVLDLSDVQLGINITVPNFQFKLTPMRLPDLPSLGLPNFGLGLGLPKFPLLPPIPTLPDLPDLPSLPKLSLPNLPSPPKLPKLLGSLSSVISIFKLISKMYCWYNSTFLISEDQVGSVIADRTERQGTMSFDFLNLQFPNMSIQALKEIRVSSHVNFNIRSDFITEFARAAVKPINSFTTDLSHGMPKKIGEDVNLKSQSVNIKVQTNNESHTDLLAEVKDAIASLEAENTGSLEVEDFAAFLEGQYDIAGLSPSLKLQLKEGLAGAKEEQEKLTGELIAYNDSRFAALKKYIQAEYDETAEMQKVIDTLINEPKILASLDYDISRRSMVAAEVASKSASLLDEYNQKFASSKDEVTADSIPETSTIAAAKHLQSSFDRLVADTTTSALSTSPQTAAGYSPSFNGIYILTPSGVQTRLFDYTDPLTGNEKAEAIDIDKDGDTDYLFLMDGVIYIKYSHTKAPVKVQDDSIKITTLANTDEYPTAPNFFHESLNTPGSLSVTFAPANKTEKSWRMEFFDHYLEWDAVDAGYHSESTAPKRVVDIFASSSDSSIGNNFVQLVPISRYLSQVYDSSSFKMEGPQLVILTGSAQFTLSPGKILYTGNNSARILYHTGSNADTYLTLDSHQGYQFNEPIQATLQSGKLYAITSSLATEPYTYTDDMIGMPILDGMKLTSVAGGFVVADTTHNSSFNIAGGSDYMVLGVGTPSDVYNLNIDYPNGYYSARIASLDYTNTAVRAGPILLAPQASSDRGAPIVETPASIKIPVYTSKDFKLSDYIVERSTYSVSVDPDTTFDSNGNTIMDDDFSSSGGSGIYLANGVLTVGPFDVIGQRTTLLKVTDQFNNTTIKPMSVEIYAPIPQITQVTGSGWVLGKINESTSLEPIHLFRVRPGSTITQLHKPSLPTVSDGSFSSGTLFTGSGVVLSISGQAISLSEKGVFSSLPPGFSVSVSPATKTSPMTMELKNSSNAGVYKQFFSLPAGVQIADTSTSPATGTGKVFATPKSTYQLIPASASDPSIPGGMYLIDSSYAPVVAIASDGNIYSLMSGVNLVYGQKDGYLLITVKKDGTDAATVWYTFDLFYTLK